MISHNELYRRFISVSNKVKMLSSLRRSAALPADYDIAESQWSAIESPLFAIEAKLRTCLKKEGREHLRLIHQAEAKRALTMVLGKMELELSNAFIYFDTFVDLLSQRHLPEMGLLLGGCDVLAWDALRKDHPALSLIEKPLVSFNRGFGASILREGVPLPDARRIPLQPFKSPIPR